MRRGAGGAAAPPPSFWATQFFGQRRSFFWAAAMVGGGCFSIFLRANDVTQTMSKGGGVLVKSPPPSGNPVSAPVICVIFWAINPSAPPNQSVPIRLCLYTLSNSCSVTQHLALNWMTLRRGHQSEDITIVMCIHSG